MDLSDLVDSLKQDLARAAEAGGEEIKPAAERLLLALDPAFRLALMDALSRAAAEIGEAAPGLAVHVVLKGREPTFAVEGAPAPRAAEAPLDNDDGEAVARITLRLPEALKSRAEALAARRGQSLNTWLVAAARAAADEAPHHHAGAGRYGPGQRLKGWVR